MPFVDLKSVLIITLASIAVSSVLTLIVRKFAIRFGQVAKPRTDRWHKKPTAMLGGIAIYLTFLIITIAAVELTKPIIVILGAASWLFLVGLLDDFLNIKPYQKLFGQIIGAVIVVVFNLTLPITGNALFDIWITLFWLIGITNAVNLLDNMDGLAAGVALIATTFLGINGILSANYADTIISAIFAGALLGFLIFNLNPASIFMGDCGSMFIGFMLASLSILAQTGGRSRGVLAILAVPVLILFVPIFDTTFVTLLRKMRGRPASQGGRDHTSHRLVALGLTERSAVTLLWVFAIIAGVLAVLVRNLPTMASLLTIGIFCAVLVIIGIHLSRVKVYSESETAAAENAVYGFIVSFTHKRRIFEVLLDAVLISAAYYLSYLFILGPFEDSNLPNWNLFLETLPILIILKLFALFVVGTYRGIWRHTTISDLIVFAKGAGLGSLLSAAALLLLYRFQNLSRAVFILDAILYFLALIASRLAFRLIRELLPAAAANGGRKVLIYGAGDGGELLSRELRNNSDLQMIPVAFVDDDPLKSDRRLGGLKVFHTDGNLDSLCEKLNIEEILISTKKIEPDRMEYLLEFCRSKSITLKRAEIKIEEVEGN
jgi:UDP-GlcNAc:undecaprenyl-phosphate GlcNAc-1-phosphate transferase